MQFSIDYWRPTRTTLSHKALVLSSALHKIRLEIYQVEQMKNYEYKVNTTGSEESVGKS